MNFMKFLLNFDDQTFVEIFEITLYLIHAVWTLRYVVCAINRVFVVTALTDDDLTRISHYDSVSWNKLAIDLPTSPFYSSSAQQCRAR